MQLPEKTIRASYIRREHGSRLFSLPQLFCSINLSCRSKNITQTFLKTTSLTYLKHVKDFLSWHYWCFAILEVRVKSILFLHFCCYIFFAYKKGSRQYIFEACEPYTSATPEPSEWFDYGKFLPEKSTHVFFTPSIKIAGMVLGLMSNDPLGGNMYYFRKLRNYVEHNLSLWSQGRLFMESFIHQVFTEHLLCASVAVLGAGVAEITFGGWETHNNSVERIMGQELGESEEEGSRRPQKVGMGLRGVQRHYWDGYFLPQGWDGGLVRALPGRVTNVLRQWRVNSWGIYLIRGYADWFCGVGREGQVWGCGQRWG